MGGKNIARNNTEATCYRNGDENQLVAFLNGLTAEGGTPLVTALEATNQFMNQHKSAASRSQMILVLVDGDDNCGGLDEVLGELKQKNLFYCHEIVGLEVSGGASNSYKTLRGNQAETIIAPPARTQNLPKVFSDAVDLMKMLDMLGKFH